MLPPEVASGFTVAVVRTHSRKRPAVVVLAVPEVASVHSADADTGSPGQPVGTDLVVVGSASSPADGSHVADKPAPDREVVLALAVLLEQLVDSQHRGAVGAGSMVAMLRNSVVVPDFEGQAPVPVEDSCLAEDVDRPHRLAEKCMLVVEGLPELRQRIQWKWSEEYAEHWLGERWRWDLATKSVRELDWIGWCRSERHWFAWTEH